VRLAILRDHQFVALTQTVFVPWDDRKLELSFSSFRDRLRPGGRETWRVTLRSAGAKSSEERAAELLAYMYDRSLDAFRPHHPPDPLSVYPNHASVGVERPSLGQAYAQWVSSENYGNVTSPAPLSPDRSKFLEGHGVGGPGRRQVYLGDAVVARAQAPAAAPPAQAMEAAAKSREENAAVAGGVTAAAPVELRSNFAETAFWMPHLLTDAS